MNAIIYIGFAILIISLYIYLWKLEDKEYERFLKKKSKFYRESNPSINLEGDKTGFEKYGLERSFESANSKEKCNHIIGITHPRRGDQKTITQREIEEGKTWRGGVFYYCPSCGMKLWEWKNIGKGQRKKIYIGD